MDFQAMYDGMKKYVEKQYRNLSLKSKNTQNVQNGFNYLNSNFKPKPNSIGLNELKALVDFMLKNNQAIKDKRIICKK
jgi:hypothetical protein